ncbi:hypothetical protein [Xenorhabdus bovienii]|uniref:hypothetical protein n=1 Tax=Xenorhabdus bovienii TaxID=40576 RepID=UPI0023B2F490|nr:hypothetical protein [Xenorhabdus bovienii]MDE9541199.1 hypothetical protein [Xenorhabdus bovienii]
MEHANARKTRNASTRFVSNHLLASALQPIRTVTQRVIAQKLGVADSTITRRVEQFSGFTDVLAAAGVEDFVMRGEKKIAEDEYRYLITRSMKTAFQNLELHFSGEVKISSDEYRYLLRQQIELSEIKLGNVA